MNTEAPSADDVARYLRAHPEFFADHPALLTDLTLPDPQRGNAISLMERQAMLLRERVKAIESRLAELMQIGRANDHLARNLVEWARSLLSEADSAQKAHVARQELQRIFGIPLVEVKIWGDPPGAHDAAAAELVSSLPFSRCGGALEERLADAMPAQWSHARSVALIPLRSTAASYAYGVIALGSSDAARFEASLGTAVLDRIGELAGAALAHGTSLASAIDPSDDGAA
jgi:uncharacterized protein YigA (DUF484 family)